jgi:hypothetical protein
LQLSSSPPRQVPDPRSPRRTAHSGSQQPVRAEPGSIRAPSAAAGIVTAVKNARPITARRSWQAARAAVAGKKATKTAADCTAGSPNNLSLQAIGAGTSMPCPQMICVKVLSGRLPSEGGGAPKGATFNEWPQHAVRSAGHQRPRKRLSILHRGDFCLRGRTSGYWARAHCPTIRPAFAAFTRTRPAHEGQTPVMGSDDDPEPPECAGQRLPRARRRHPSPHTSKRPRKRPSAG